MSYNNTQSHSINQCYFYPQQQQKTGGGGTQNTQCLASRQQVQQQPYTNTNYYFNPAASHCGVTTGTTANSGSTYTTVPTAENQYYESLYNYNNYKINNNNNNNNSNDNNMGVFYNSSAATLNSGMNGATSTVRSYISNNQTVATSTPSSSSGNRLVSDWLDLSPLDDDPLSLHPYYRPNQQSSNNYAATTNNYNNNHHHHYHGDMARSNNAANSHHHNEDIYYTSNSTLYTHGSHADLNNNINTQHMKYPLQQQENNHTNNSNSRASQLSNQLMQHPLTSCKNNTATTIGHTRNISSTSNNIYPYSPSDFEPVDVFTTLGNYSNNEYRSAADQHHRNSIPSSSSTTSSRATTTDNTNTSAITTTYDGIFLGSDETCDRIYASPDSDGNGIPSPQLYQQLQQVFQPPTTYYHHCNKDASLPATNHYKNNNIVNSQTIDRASTTTTKTTLTAARTVSEPSQLGTTESITVKISGISSQLLSSSDVVQIVKSRGTDVTTKYLPCVDFLVHCQQELRKAVEKNQQLPFKQRYSPKQFYSLHFQPLSDQFYQKNYGIMPTDHLKTASEAIKNLLAETKKSESLGCDNMKITFLGGMREGQSWGLRNWLSKYGSALQICNELEMILVALQKLEPSSKLTINLASQIRKEVSATRARLLKEIPKAYQQFSSAHPFLPFFHRLDAALKGLAEFDPEDDDVIILDDDEQEKLKAEVALAAVSETMSRGSNQGRPKVNNKRTVVEVIDDSHVPATNHTNASVKRRATISTGAESSNNSTESSEANSSTGASNGIPTLDSADLALNTDHNAKETSQHGKKYPFSKNSQFDIQGRSMPLTTFIAPINDTTGVNNRRHSDGVDGSLDELPCDDDFSHIFDNDSNCSSSKLFDGADTITRDTYIPSQDDWRCMECEFINTSDVDYCLMCERTKAPSTAMSKSSSIDGTLLLF